MASSYELMLVISPEATDEQVEGIQSRVKAFVTERGGEYTKEDHWGRRKLAYHIGKFAEGNYYLAYFDLAPASAKELEGTLNLMENVIRHLLVLQEPVGAPGLGKPSEGVTARG